jgi:hypothetical protein
MTIEQWASTFESVVTASSFIVGGIWVYMKFIRQQEDYSNIEFSADMNFIGKQADYWIVELIALVENKGKVQHKMEEFNFDLNALLSTDNVEVSNDWGGQVNFPQELAKGSFLPKHSKSFFIGPGVKAKYSYVARIPQDATFLIFHCWFKYIDRKESGHTAEKSVRVPNATLDTAPNN